MMELLTNAGTAAALAAGATGPKIDIGSIKLGSGYNYTPTASQTAFNGVTVYTAPPSAYTIIDSNTVEYRLDLTPSVGGFSFGEIGLFTADGVLFAIKSLPELQHKIASPNDGWNRLIIRIRIVFTNAPALINWSFYNTSIGRIWEIDNYTMLEKPDSDTIQSNAFIVNYKDDFDNATLAIRESGNTWAISTHTRVYNGTVATVGSSQITYTGAYANMLPYAQGRYLIQYLSGAQRGRVVPVTALSANFMTLTYPNTFPSPQAGDSFEILMSNPAYAASLGLKSGIQPGMVFYDAAATPSSTLCKPCDGRELSRTYYSVLFSRIGTTYGAGNGSTTFNIPDLRGVFIRGLDSGKGYDPGRALGSYQADAFGSHLHYNGIANDLPRVYVYGSTTTDMPGQATHQVQETGGVTVQGLTSTVGGTETRPKNIALLPVIVAATGFEQGVLDVIVPPSPPPVETPGKQSFVFSASTVTTTIDQTAQNKVLATFTPTGTATLTIQSGSIPTGCTVNATTSEIKLLGTASATGSFSAVLKLENSGYIGTITVNVTVVANVAVNITSRSCSSWIGSVSVTSPTALYELRANGEVWYTISSDYPVRASGEWLLAGAASAVEVRATLSSGTPPTSGTLNAWMNLSTTRTWALSSSSADCIMLLEIRRVSDSVVIDTATIELAPYYMAPGDA